MRAKNATSSPRLQTCPVLTLDGDIQEPCEQASVQAQPARRVSKAASFFAVAALSFGLVACNDDGPKKDEPCVGEECEEPCVGDACETPAETMQQCLAIVTTTTDDGALAVLDMNSLDIRTDITSIHKDAGFISDGDTLYVVNRLGADNIQALNVADGFSTSWQYSVGANTNPATLVVSGDYGFIPLYGGGEVMIVDLKADNEADFILDASLPIPPNNEWDGDKAEVANAIAHNGVIYVISQGLGEDWSCAAESRSRILAFDAVTFEPKAVFEDEVYLDLATCNAEQMVVDGDTLYVQSLGDYRAFGGTEDDGAIEAIDLAAGKSLGVLLTETSAGDRDIFQIYAANDGKGLWVNLAGSSDFNALDLHYLDLSGDEPVLSASFYTGYIWAIAESDEYIFITDRTAAAEGIYVLDKATKELISEEPLDTGLPPRGVTPFERMGTCF